MKHIVFIVLVLLFSNVFGQQRLSEYDIDRRIESDLLTPWRNDKEKDLAWLTADIRPLVIQKLLARNDNPERSKKYTLEALVKIGHWETILGLIEDMKTPLKDTDGLMYANEEIIPYLMPLVYSGSTESPNLPGVDVFKNPVRLSAIQRVLGKIQKCNDFPEKSRKWASELGSNGENYKDEAWVSLITGWWEHNKDAILEKRYKDATWLPTYKGIPIDCLPEEMRKKVEYLEKKYATRLAKIAGKADAPGERARNSLPSQGGPSEIIPDAHPSRFFWTGIGGFLTVGCYIFWRRFTIKDA